MSSISSFVAIPIETLNEFVIMILDNFILFFGLSFFESTRFSIQIDGLKITAAEKTEPTRLPLPTSSTPAIIFLDFTLMVYNNHFIKQDV